MILNLVDLPFDTAQAARHRCTQRLQLGVVVLLEPVIDLTLDRSHAQNRFVGVGHAIPNTDREIETLLKVGQRCALG